MTKTNLLVIFNIIAGTSSILGLMYNIYSSKLDDFIRLSKSAFIICLILSVYILFVPDNFLSKNTSKKIGYYSTSVSYDPNSVILRQEGNFSFNGTGIKTIQYKYPYLTPPDVEVFKVEPDGHDIYLKSRKEDIFKVSKRITGGFSSESYKWIARGKPLYQLEGEIVVKEPQNEK